MEYWRSPAGRASYRRNGNKIELRKALRGLGGIKIRLKADTTSLYKELVVAVNKNKEKAKKLLYGGSPDAIGTRTEFKFGLDYLRDAQIILDILNGRKSKLRWVPSYDSLEMTLRGNKNESILFDSYLSFLQACEKAKTLDFK